MHGERQRSSFMLLHIDGQFSKHHLLKRLSFPVYIFDIFVKNQAAVVALACI